MPYRDPERQRACQRESAKRGRARRAAERRAILPALDPPRPAAPALAVAEWSSARLRVPPGHATAGEPMELPAYFVRFLADALAPGIREAACFVARKNAKSAAVAVLILAHLAGDGPLRRRGWRAGVASLSREKAAELWMQCREIAEASALPGLRFGKVPRCIESPWGVAQFLSADRTAGHASGFDLAVVDELGLFPEAGRDLVAGLLSSTSARDGRLVAISVVGDSPLSAEMIGRAADRATVVHIHQAARGCALDDPAAWRAANPTLGAIKSESYMRDMARRAAAAPSEQSTFRAHDLNQPAAPGRDMIVALDRWEAVAGEAVPERAGSVFLGFDLGGSTSMTAAAAYWPATGRLEVSGAYGDEPDLAARGEADGVGERYLRMAERGELATFPGRVTPCGPFLASVAERLAGETVMLAVADRYRMAEGLDALAAAGVAWPMEWRAQGAGRDGSADVRALQRSIEGGRLRPGKSLMLESAILESAVRHDANGNPALEKSRSRGRIDALAAAVLAVGAGTRNAVPTLHTVLHVPFE